MSECKPALLEAWLEMLCRMIPGISHAGLLTDTCSDAQTQIQWPPTGKLNDDVVSAAKMAARQKKTVTTILSSVQGNDLPVDMIIAVYLTDENDFVASLGLHVRIKPSQQSVIMQLLQWGQGWLQLLLQQGQSEPQTPPSDDEPAVSRKQYAFLNFGLVQWVISGVLLLVLLMTLISGMYRVSASASLEGRIQRVIVAPFDSYITQVFARAGETVKTGDVIAELDRDELMLQQQSFVAQKNEYTRQYRQALSARETAQAHIFKSQVSQVEAKLKLVEKKIQRSTLSAPLDGVIISGDLSRSLGAPVKAGDVLFEVAPLDEYRLVIFVSEKQVVDVQPTMHGVLNLTAMPGQDIAFTVKKVSPVFEENLDGIAYRVEASINDHHTALRPGMQGVAKIDIGQRRYAWIYLHELYDAVRLWAWSWLP